MRRERYGIKNGCIIYKLKNQSKMRTQFYELNLYGSKWIKTKLSPEKLSYKWILLYNNDCKKIKGIGIYKPILR